MGRAAPQQRPRGQQDRLRLRRSGRASCATAWLAAKSSKRSRSTTVRPTRRAARMRRRDAVDQADQARVDRRPRLRPPAQGALRRRSNGAVAPRMHRPRIAVVRQRVQLPPRRPPQHRRPASASGSLRHLPHGRDAAADGACADVAGPTPHSRSTGSGCRNASSASGGTTSSPSGFATALATLARNLVRATPTVIGSPTRSRTSRRSRGGDLGRSAGDVLEPAHVQEGLVDRQALDHRRHVLEHAKTALLASE